MPHRLVPSTDPLQRPALTPSWRENESGGSTGIGIIGGLVTALKAPDQTESDLLHNAELVQLRVRVVALENLVIALLATTPGAQTLARDMAQYISPRVGSTEHPLTLHAASLMNHLIDRAAYFGAAAEASD